MLQLIPSFYAKYSKNSLFIFKKEHTKNIVWAKSTALPTRMPKFPYNPIADFTFYCWVTLKSCYRNWTHSVSHMNKWTVSIHCSSVSSVQKLLSRKVKCLIISKEQSILIKETEEWTDFPASRKRELWGKSKESTYWSSSNRQDQRKQVDQSSERELNKLKRQNMKWN